MTSLFMGSKSHPLRPYYIVWKLTDDNYVNQIVSFDPVIPETNMIHVYIKAPFETCEEVRDALLEKTGVKVFSRLRAIPETDARFDLGYKAYFERTIGRANGCISDEIILEAWRDYGKKLLLESLQAD